MASSSFAGFREAIREDFRDELGSMFTDEELDAFIDSAQREYCVLTGALTGECKAIVPFRRGPCIAPPDFIRPVRVVGLDGREIPEIGWRRLGADDFRHAKASRPSFVMWDYDTWGQYRFYPACVEDYSVVGTLYYSRMPKDGVLEVRERDALKDYALFLCFSHAGKPQASSYYSLFSDAVAKRNSLRGSLYTRPQVRRGCFY